MKSNESIDHGIGWVIKLQIIFFLMSILLLALDFIFRDSINGFVWLRSGGLAILSLVFIRFGFMQKEKRDQRIFV
ncbi:hypothetical protein [Peribacillus loiseleuriae]|uniref:hypothetical protein n=1 Tax=Peribacillus loiseleuriae TaxID=1679170 RepID=UPI003CFDEDDC